MDLFDKEIKKIISKDIMEPDSYEEAIKNALNKKKRYNLVHFIKKIIITILSILSLCCGSIIVYAISGGKIEGVPVMKWLGIKISDNYVDYKEDVNKEIKTYNKTSVELVSSLASDYVTILEFDVKLSDEDKEYLRLGKCVYTPKDEEDIKAELKRKAEIELINDKGSASEEEISQRAEKMYEEKDYDDSRIEEYKKYVNTIELGFNKENDNGLDNMPSTKDLVYIDGEKIICRNYETALKISDNEYKIYHIFLLTEDDLKGKTNFNLTLKNNIIANCAQLKSGEKPEIKNLYLINTPNNQRFIKIDGEFSVDLSKDKILKDSKIIKPIDKKSIYKNITVEVQEINENPIQTIIKTKILIKGVDSNKRYFYSDDIHNPLWIDFKITDDTGRELTSESFETKKVLIYNNGKTEEWAPGDIKDMARYKNGTFELTQYIILENSNSNKIKITPSYEILEKQTSETKYQELENIEIDLK